MVMLGLFKRLLFLFKNIYSQIGVKKYKNGLFLKYTSLGEMCHTLYLCLYLCFYFILKGSGLGFNLKFNENSSKIIKGPGVAFGFWWLNTRDKSKQLKFQLWLRLRVNCSTKY